MAQIIQGLVLTLWTDGGQGRARRNAWACMAEGSKRARDRADVEGAVRAAAASYDVAAAGAAVGH